MSRKCTTRALAHENLRVIPDFRAGGAQGLRMPLDGGMQSRKARATFAGHFRRVG